MPDYTGAMAFDRIAFLVLAHRDALQVERLCRRLAPHAVFVHVDARSAEFSTAGIASLPNVTLVEPRTAVYWTDFSMVDATLTALKVARKHGPFDRYMLMSGECYPVKPVSEIVTAFAGDPLREWIGITAIRPGSHLQTLISRHWRIRPLLRQPALDAKLRPLWNKVAKIIGRNLEAETGLKPWFGNSWWALTDRCVSMILQTMDRKPSLARAYRSVYAPDEQIFHTIIGNSEFAPRAIPIDDHGAGTNQIAPLHEVAPEGERYFHSTEADFQRAAGTGKFFIRKVSSESTGPLLDRIDRELLQSVDGGA